MRKTISLILVLCLLSTSIALADVLGEYPITTEPMTLTAWAVLPPAATNTFNENTAALEMERITGIHVDFNCVSYNGQEEKRALMLSSGNYPNFFFCADLTNDELSQLARMDQIYALDEFLEYAPNLTALFDRIEGLEGAAPVHPADSVFALFAVSVLLDACDQSQDRCGAAFAEGGLLA